MGTKNVDNITTDDVRSLRELALFAGAGGGILGGKLLGWKTVCAVEIEPYAAAVLCARQNDGILPPFPVWDDVRNFDGHPWKDRVDIISGGFPCQDISCAGKGAGIDGSRSGLWREFARIIGEVRPSLVFVENSNMLVKRGLSRVLGDLAALGYDAEWTVMGANEVGAPHIRKRTWLLAVDSQRRDFLSHAQLHGTGRWEQQSESPKETSAIPHTDDNRCDEVKLLKGEPCQAMGQASERKPRRADCEVSDSDKERQCCSEADEKLDRKERPTERRMENEWWHKEPGDAPGETKPDMGRMAHGVAARVDRLKAIGNGQVPLVAATAFRELLARLAEPV